MGTNQLKVSSMSRVRLMVPKMDPEDVSSTTKFLCCGSAGPPAGPSCRSRLCFNTARKPRSQMRSEAPICDIKDPKSCIIHNFTA